MKMNYHFELRLHTDGVGLKHESAVIIIFTTGSNIHYTPTYL